MQQPLLFLQGFSQVALIGGKPPPHTLVYSFNYTERGREYLHAIYSEARHVYAPFTSHRLHCYQ